MAKCVTCGTSLGLLSFTKECKSCMANREERERLQKSKETADKEKLDKELRNTYSETLKATTLETLPVLGRDLSTEQNMVVKIPLSEKVYAVMGCRVLENRVINRIYERIGWSIPVVGLKGMRIGKSTGQLISERGLVETTRGALFLTNKRLIVDPKPGLKPIKINYSKIEGYSVGDDYIELWMGKEYPIVIELNEKFGEESDVCAHILRMIMQSPID